MSNNKPYYDFEASKLKLVARVRMINESSFNPTVRKKELERIADHLEKTADLLNSPGLLFLEAEFDKDPPPEIGIDGWPLELEESNLGKFAGTIWRMRALAGTARNEARSLPNSRERPALPYAASCLLHLIYQCGMEKPTRYKDSPAVSLLGEICNSAKMPKSPETLLGALKKALDEFDPLMSPPGIDKILVINQ